MSDNKKDLTRRDFMKGSTMVAGGVILAPSAFSAPIIMKDKQQLKLAVVGCGGRGTGAVSQ
ncbi:MAG: twin-arginine translocation signal domain-containing protein, partial [Cyclobacteriaceae bacterium]|nr:twin-arginine translocation signal domain-containing protein [Cyclobacteriaceae bacterium]